MLTACQIFLCFLSYSFLGWCCESVYCSIGQGRLINRGFLNGPLCPVYGFGALLVIFLLDGAEGNAAALFLAGMAATSLLEYLTSWLLEKLFHMKWWGYSHYHFQINGRVCLLNSLMFGGLSVILMLGVRPRVNGLVGKLSPMAAALLTGLFAGVLLTDTFVTARDLLRMKGHLDEFSVRLADLHQRGDEQLAKLQQALGGHKEEFAARREALENDWKKAAAELSARLDGEPAGRRWRQRRIFAAFPDLKAQSGELTGQLKKHFAHTGRKGGSHD